MDLVVHPSEKLQGDITLPGDKSISHRAILLTSLASGQSVIHGFLPSEDCFATLNAMCSLGVMIQRSNDYVVVDGVGLKGLRPSANPIDCGNSGTSMRLLAGLLATQPFVSVLQGDLSLQDRPMGRIVEPLKQMGAIIKARLCADKMVSPLHIQGNPALKGIDFTLPIPSAQVKSCLLLAGLYASSKTTIIENNPSRDHTERMLQYMGCPLKRNLPKIALFPPKELRSCEIDIPGDISSAAFFMVGASMVPGSHVVLRQVGINPFRTGIIAILRLMGAEIELQNTKMLSGEPIADIVVKGTKLRGISVPPQWVVSAIDEFPIIFVAACSARGTTIIRGIGELRFKETDRIKAMAQGLHRLGAQLELLPDGVAITGTPLQGGVVQSEGDHRIAMSFAMASLIAADTITIRDCDNIATSFPNFCTLAQTLGMNMRSSF